MAKFSFNEEAATQEQTGGAGKKVLDTGVYDVTINTASQTIASTGTEGIDWNFTVDGAQYPNIVYGMWIAKPNGDTLFSYNIVQGLMGILGINELNLYEKEIEVKNGTKRVQAYKELEGKKVKVAIQKVLDAYKDEVREKNEIKAFFDYETGQTYAEKVKGTDAKQIEYYKTKLGDKETEAYKKWKVDAEDEADAEDSSGEGSLL